MSRFPDYKISVFNKETEKVAIIGAGWRHDTIRGAITLQFNPFVSLPKGDEFVINLFPYDVRDELSERGAEGYYDEEADNRRDGGRRRRRRDR